MTAKPLYAQCTELDADNIYERNDLEKGQVLRRFEKTVRVGAEVTTGGRLFQRQLPATCKCTIVNSGQAIVTY